MIRHLKGKSFRLVENEKLVIEKESESLIL